MFTTAAIMFFGVIADIAVCYEAKDLVVFYDNEPLDPKVQKDPVENNKLLTNKGNA